jgi:Flp pilus assembly protein TadB
MSPSMMLALMSGLLGGGGLLLVVLAWRGTPEGPSTTPSSPGPARRSRRDSRVGRAVLSIAGGVLTWVISGWPAAGLIVTVAAWGLPVLFATSRRAVAAIDRVEGVEDWVRRLSDVLIVGVGLSQAILVTASSAPAPIAEEVAALGARISARWPTEDALRAFADDIGDADADLVAAALILAQRRKGPGVAAALTALADALAEEVAMRRRVEADRAKPRATARAVTLITLGVVAVGALNGSYLQPYATPLGQLVLVGVTGVFVAALAWMRAMTLTSTRRRLLASSPRTVVAPS